MAELKKYWFKAHKYGYGWSPTGWQGWLILVVYLFMVFYSLYVIDKESHSVSDTLLSFLPRFFIYTLILAIVCFFTGEPLKWRWGEKKK